MTIVLHKTDEQRALEMFEAQRSSLEAKHWGWYCVIDPMSSRTELLPSQRAAADWARVFFETTGRKVVMFSIGSRTHLSGL